MIERKVGDIRITRVIESERPDFDAGQFFPNITPEQWAPYRQRLAGWAMDPASNGLVFPMQSFLVRTPHHTIVVDTCVGDHKKRLRPNWNMTTSGDFLKRFAETGVRPEQVDYVLCTHMHTDHVGWNTRWENDRWVPTFPKAKYIFHKQEYAVWEAEHAKGANPPGTVFRDNCLPIVEAGQALLVDDAYALDDTITLTPTPGHSPCHCCVNIFSRGQRAVVTGDMMHHVIQCREPDWSPRVDWDGKQAAVSRRKFLAEVADTDTLILPIHFPTPTAGMVIADGDRFNYRFKRD
jgi:glyoxylase-like metal-dependent hydrolase (beta-lactamase superfamily II)